jgi:hypothetical protein
VAYVTPITDRTAADIAARNSKAYMNVADWTRIYGNSQLVNSLATVIRNEIILFNALALPTITTIPTVAYVNTMLANIDRLRLAVADVLPDLTEVKDDWLAGSGNPSPNYIDANLWESTLHAIWTYYEGATFPVCPTLTANLTIPAGQQFIYIDCIDADGFDIDLQGTARLAII